MDIEVVVGEAKPCPDLASRLVMVYSLLLRIAEEAETGRKKASEGRELGGNPSGGEREANLNNGIAAPHDPP